MSIKAGEYKVVAVLNISHSLLSQSKSSPQKPKDVYKVLLQSNSTNHISYFIDGADFGPCSILLFRRDTPVLVCGKDYEVIENVSQVDNKVFIERLITKLRIKANRGSQEKNGRGSGASFKA